MEKFKAKLIKSEERTKLFINNVNNKLFYDEEMEIHYVLKNVTYYHLSFFRDNGSIAASTDENQIFPYSLSSEIIFNFCKIYNSLKLKEDIYARWSTKEMKYIFFTNKNSILAEQLHEASMKFHRIESDIEDLICDFFEEHEPEVYRVFDFHITSDYYDNSIEIFFEFPADEIAYPYEPCLEIRDKILELGFDIVFWNFADENGNFSEEIRGFEPRRFSPRTNRDIKHINTKYGYVDSRFNEEEWKKKYYRKSSK